MSRKFYWFQGLFLFWFSIGLGQNSMIYSHENVEYNRAKELYKDQQFLSAMTLFKKVKEKNNNLEIESDCTYFIANCALKLEQENGETLMEDFIKNYPNSNKNSNAYQDVANFYFANGKYRDALIWLEKMDYSNVERTEMERFNFMKAYCYFSQKNVKEATPLFEKVVNSKTYGSQAKYYLGFMEYEVDNYKKANTYFEAVEDEKKYKEKMAYFQADMNFKLGNFQKAIDLGKDAMKKADASEKSELNKIIGESFFNLNKYAEAIPYLEQYKGKKGKWNNTDFYLLGYSHYKNNEFENAINQFNKIINGNDYVAQNAYYHLGESYMKSDRKQEAFNAFKNASEMDFDLKIQEDSFYNYAKISYEIGNPYKSVPEVLNNFMTKYPKNTNNQEIEQLLISSYVTAKNYKDALVLLEKNKTAANKETYQKVLFYRGLELFTDSFYTEALALFKKSIAENKNAMILSRATFWQAETEYLLEQFENAVTNFNQFLNLPESKNTIEFKNANYHLGYTYFKLKNYDNSIAQFDQYIKTNPTDKARLNDATLRMADAQFVTAKYWPAMESYNKVIGFKLIDTDYAAFQKAICYGFVNKTDTKIEELNAFLKNYPKSKYRNDALFELANTYTNVDKSALALATFDQLINEQKNGIYTSKALLRQGLIYSNTQKPDLALTKFKKVAANFPKTQEALEAVTAAKEIYVNTGRVDEYATWVRTMDFVNVSNAELDNTTYEAAERQYEMNNTKAALTGFANYTKSIPDGIHSLKANFYAAQLYFGDNQASKSIVHYQFVINQPASEYTEQSLARLCEIYLKNNDYKNAIPVLRRLETEGNFPQNISYAQSNLMRAYYEEKDYENALIYTEKILNNPKADEKLKFDAQIVIARSAIKTNDEAKAKIAYSKLMKAKGELGAEAHYYDAYFKNKEGKYDASNKVIAKINKDFQGYKYFGVKALLLMAKNQYALKDSFSAIYILENIIKNFTEYKDVIEEAQTLLDTYKLEESKRNASVTN
jgi:tetratricopeptide (TPR) repeat protein